VELVISHGSLSWLGFDAGVAGKSWAGEGLVIALAGAGYMPRGWRLAWRDDFAWSTVGELVSLAQRPSVPMA
jgi:hypothetical protein